LVVTSYLGRNPAAVHELVKLCDALSVGVIESGPSVLNFPSTNPHHEGSQWTTAAQHPALAEADLVLVLDSDVPWIPSVNRPSPGARIIHVDLDPLKEQMPIWYIGATEIFRADSAVALRQINARLSKLTIPQGVEERRARHIQNHRERQQERRALEALS